jgi:hypothetical protein
METDEAPIPIDPDAVAHYGSAPIRNEYHAASPSYRTVPRETVKFTTRKTNVVLQ